MIYLDFYTKYQSSYFFYDVMYIRFLSVYILYIELILFFLYFNIYIDYTYEEIQRTCNYELLLLTYHVIFVSLSIKIDFY